MIGKNNQNIPGEIYGKKPKFENQLLHVELSILMYEGQDHWWRHQQTHRAGVGEHVNDIKV